jgi:hypothetical protein
MKIEFLGAVVPMLIPCLNQWTACLSSCGYRSVSSVKASKLNCTLISVLAVTSSKGAVFPDAQYFSQEKLLRLERAEAGMIQ